MNTKCLIIDDEPLAIEIIESYLKEFSDIEIVDKCLNAMAAFEIIKRQQIDLIFLDIQMPQINGIRFLRSIHDPPSVIITTGYREYALDGFELDVVDYLLKPIEFERFLKAIDKYYQFSVKREKSQPILQKQKSSAQSIFVKSDRKLIQIGLNEIYFLESMKDYVIIHLRENKFLTKESLSYFEKNLPAAEFVRIHRAYIVAKNKVKAISKDSVEINKRELPIGRKYKNNIRNFFCESF